MEKRKTKSPRTNKTDKQNEPGEIAVRATPSESPKHQWRAWLWSRQNKNKTKLVVVSRSGCSTLMEKQQTHTAPTKLTTDAITLRAAPSKAPKNTKNKWHAFAGEQAEQKQNWY